MPLRARPATTGSAGWVPRGSRPVSSRSALACSPPVSGVCSGIPHHFFAYLIDDGTNSVR